MTRKPRLLIGIASAALVSLGALATLAWMRPPADLDVATERPTAQGLFRVAYSPSVAPPPVNQLHSWTLRVTTPAGQPVDGATIAVDGDMPQHGHGLPTRPQVTRSLDDGRYLLEGVKFQMGGWWVVDVTVTDSAGRTDTVRFNLSL